MAKHNITGKTGERLGYEYLIAQDFKIIHRNWRYKNWEVDVIACKGDILHFIEIKTRTSLRYGYPEDSVDIKKIRYLINAAEEYLYMYPQWKKICFDILSININENETAYFFIEDVYL